MPLTHAAHHAPPCLEHGLKTHAPLLLIALLAACGGDEAETNNAANNAAAPDMATADMSTTPDAQPDQADPADQALDAEPDAAAEDMAPDAEPDAPACDPAATARGLVAVNAAPADGTITATQDGAVWTATIDASAGGPVEAPSRSYLYLDLATGQRVDLSDADAHASDAWHIGFKRAELRSNSADSGPGALLVARVDNTDWDTAQPPNPAGGGWITDDFVSDTCEVVTYGRGSIQTAFNQWYDYDPVNHTLNPPPNTIFFLYNTVTHAAFKLQITAYDSGIYTVRWAPLGR